MTAAVFDAWAALDLVRRGYPPAKPAKPANPTPSAPAGLAGLATLAEVRGPDPKRQAQVAFLQRAAEAASDALQAPDLALDAERAVMASFYSNVAPPPCDIAVKDWAEVGAWMAGWPSTARKDVSQ